MIPKTFHRIWLGNQPIPQKHEFWWGAWQRLYPDYSFKTWTENEFECETGRISLAYDKARNATSFAMKSDILRIAILAEIGGIYIDTDMMPINRYEFSDFKEDILICISNNAIIGSPRNGQNIEHIFNKIMETDISNHAYLNVVNLTGPIFIESTLRGRDVKYVDQSLFYPYHHDESLSKIFTTNLDRTYAAHVWHGSWYGELISHQKIFNLFSLGNIHEMKDAVGGHKFSKINSLIETQIKITESTRKNILHAIHSSHLINALLFSDETQIVFSSFKICLHLNNIQDKITAWSIGTGNGHVNNPLRAAIAHFDINATFIEPSPYLKERIENNFKRNSNIKVISKAFFPSTSNIKMLVSNTDKYSHRQLPDWIENLSHIAIPGIDHHAIIESSYGNTTGFSQSEIDIFLDEMMIDTIDAKSLFEQDERNHPDLVSIEVNYLEGMILSDILQSGIRPKMLIIINTGISENMSEYLEHANYKVVSDKNGFITAVSFEYIKEYCNYLFMEFGIRSVYDRCIKSLVPH